MADREELIRRFQHHPPRTEARIADHEKIRAATADLAALYYDVLPASREASLALTELQNAAMWANAAIALNE